MKTLVLGLGNPILCDDGVGCRIAAALQQKIDNPDIDIREESLAGLDLLELLSVYDRAIIIDAIQTGKGRPGRLYRLGPEALAQTRHAASPHDVNLATALELGEQLKLKLPREIIIFAIEVEDVTTFREECTPAVLKAIPKCVEVVISELQKPLYQSLPLTKGD
ncbi:MAG: hydrogenase maturation protease [Dehalococcoidales bacterium]|jgi:hydrogenase maturation protease